jgi:hypothetical protein
MHHVRFCVLWQRLLYEGSMPFFEFDVSDDTSRDR